MPVAATANEAGQTDPPGVSAQPSAPASAAETNPSANLNEIVVTAQFRKETVQDTPLAITALNSAMLEDKGAVDLAGVGDLAPNVSLSKGSQGGSFGQMASIFIRGVGQTDPHFAQEPGVGIYVDDVYYGVVSGAIFQLLDVDRVEVLRGPQGTLSGKNSIGGSIKLYAKRPGPDSDGNAELSYGSYDHVGARAAGNITFVDGKLFGRLSAAATRADGYLDRLDYACVTGTSPSKRLGGSCKIGSEGGQNTITGRASLRWIASDRIEDTLTADVIDDTSENPAFKQTLQSAAWAGNANYLTPRNSYTNYEDYTAISRAGVSAGTQYSMPTTTPLHGWGMSNALHFDLTDWLRLDSITAERQSTVTFSATQERSPASMSDQVWRLAHRQFTQELRLTGEFGKLVEWTVGGFYYDASGVGDARINIPFGLSPGGGDGGLGIAQDFIFIDPVKTQSKSVFIHTTFHPSASLGDKLGITLDGRWSDDSKKYTFNHLDTAGNPAPQQLGLQNLSVLYKDARYDYRLGIDYKWTQAILTYAQVSTGYKGGGVNPRPFFTTQAITYNPEILTAYEVGLKGQFFDRHLTLNVAGFYDRYDDFQGQLHACDAFSPFPGAPCGMTTNVGDAHVKGVEIESQLHILGGLSLDTSLGWLDFNYTRTDPASDILLSDKNVYSPDFTASAGIQYVLGLGQLGGTLTPRLDYSYRASMFGDFTNQDASKIASVGLLNARLTWANEKSNWQASLAFNNLLDRFYYQSVVPSNPLFSSQLGGVGPPREILFAIRRNF